ncbi:hypothetical protein WN51_08193 [Melipona quadrifasciata]|uniref:Uncharacterized protein n=1 Tax=Melipona quadrifasciata TaxID=166423 RepID=A0A0M8ZND5_9HYME|nr:hypothetical protein WN51_08193 [Melipona quadrifasciata]
MRKITAFLRANNPVISRYAVIEGVDWHFILSHAPHFGGLWERSVRSTKQHLLRVVGETRLIFDELYTVLTQIESCMNSRPLHPLSVRSCRFESLDSWALPDRTPAHRAPIS